MKTELEEMAAEYRFDYTKAQPNRFAEKLKFDTGRVVERFVAEEKNKNGKRKVRSSPPNK
jgi:hypothetical protein